MKKNNILILMSSFERDWVFTELVKKALVDIDPSVSVKVEFWSRGVDIDKVIAYKPSVVLCFPPTIQPLIELLALLKCMYGTHVLTFVTEGALPADRSNQDFYFGYYSYPKALIDEWGAWGNQYKTRLQEYLDRKIGSGIGIKVFGYPMWEYESIREVVGSDKSEIDFTRLKAEYKRVVLVLSGFPEANKTVDDWKHSVDAYDYRSSNAEESITSLIEVGYKTRAFKDRYYSIIIELARQYPDTAFVIKLHPKEHEQKHNGRDIGINVFDCCDNILVMEENVSFSRFYKYIDAVIHYKSTLGWEAYVHSIPTICICTDDEIIASLWYTERAAGKTYYCSEGKLILEEFEKECSKFTIQESNEQYLFDYFNYSRGKEYKPSRHIAEWIYSYSHRMREKDKSIFYGAFSCDLPSELHICRLLLSRFQFKILLIYLYVIIKNHILLRRDVERRK